VGCSGGWMLFPRRIVRWQKRVALLSHRSHQMIAGIVFMKATNQQ
jgi:hypothetical protein